MIDIRIATSDNIADIQHVAERTFANTYRSILTKEQLDYMFDMMYSTASLQKQFDDGQTFYLAYHDGSPCGFVSVEKQDDNLFHLHKLYVLPEMHGTGLGKTLITTIFRHARTHCDAPDCFVELNVNRNNKALGFYQHVGMHIDREVDIPIGGGFFMNDYIMRINVR